MKDRTPKELDELLKQGKQARSKLEPVWFMNLSYYDGIQWVGWNGNALYRPRLKANRITIVDNRIQPCVRTEVAKMTKNRPVFTVSPTTSDEEDLNAAEMGEQLMRYLWKHLSLRAQTTKALMWSRICGAGFLKVHWDPSLGSGTDVVVGPGGKVLQGADGKSLKPGAFDPAALSAQLGVDVASKRVNQGDLRVESRSPFQMMIDPLADSFDDAEWVIEETVKSLESVQRMYNTTVIADSVSNPGLIESRMGSLLPSTSSYKGAKVKEYWCKPNTEHPSGYHAVWCQDRYLFEEEQPFDPMPYVMLSNIPVPGRIWPTSIVEQLRPIQTELNKVLSQIAENCNRVGNPTILASKQAVQDPDKFADSTTMPGGIYFFDDQGSPNSVPTYLQAPPLPVYVTDRVAQIQEAFMEISGQHDVSSANVPPGVTAASAINLLMEADDTRLGPVITDFEDQLASLGQKLLKLAAHYYTDARTIKIAGDNGVWQIYDFRGAMLRNNTQVEVQAGSAFPHSKAAKQAWMQDMLNFFVQSGNPPHGKQLAQFLKDQEVGGAEKMIEEYTLDERQAERENIKLAQGVVVMIHDYDDDQAHIDAHQDEQKSQRYEFFTPHVQQAFELHVAAHKSRLAQQQQAQQQLELQQQQGASSGGSSAGGAPGAPGAQGPSPAPPGDQASDQMAGMQAAVAQAQGAHQVDVSGAQAGHSMALSAAQKEQAQRHTEELHQQSMQHRDEKHKLQLGAAVAQAQARVTSMAKAGNAGGNGKSQGEAKK